MEEHHLRCSKCHDIDKNCSECHSKEIKNPFNHSASTGFALKSYHSKLACTDCHGGELKFSKANEACISCHSGWNQSTFKHSVTGLTLNEIHSEFECTDCHLENKFDTSPSCESCHEDIKFPQSLPGKRNN